MKASWSGRVPHVGVVGAGVIGLASAQALLARGLAVTVFERAEPGRGASWAAAGMLAATAEALESGVEAPAAMALARESLALWPAWTHALGASSGRNVGFRPCGSLSPAFDASSEAQLDARVARAEELGLEVHRLDASAAREREPSLADDVLGALFAPDDWTVDNRALLAALEATVAAQGGVIRPHSEVLRIDEGELVLGPAASQERVACDLVVLAPGWRAAAFAGPLGAGAEPLARVIPVKGQLLAVDAGARAPRVVVRGDGIYATPRADGRVIIGATVEPGVSDETVEDATIAQLHDRAAQMLPVLADAPLLETWSGVRPGLAEPTGAVSEEGPVIAEIAPGVLAAAGHFRNGILLAPATAARVADLAAARLGV